ncbi:BON domain-containing protein [Stappia indica]|uniref:BON domain-containing protein n=1 Tax=Stappia indica TaxID=538381 RepID=UPI00082CCAE8|nr:BON domain-containing protein [Stappia indica]
MPYNDDIRRDTRMREERARERLREEREGRRGRRYPGVGALYGPYPMIGEGLYPQYPGYYGEDYDEYRRDDPWRGAGYAERYGDRYRRRGRDDRDFWDRASDEVASWFGDDDAEHRREMDKHRGKGPRGYKRSDARISEDVHDRLSDDPYLDASNISVEVNDREVVLSGLVDHRHDKRRAEDCAESVSGVTHVQNNLRVRPHPVPPQSDLA